MNNASHSYLMSSRGRARSAIAAITLIISACGGQAAAVASPTVVTREIAVEMTDFAFTPSSSDIKAGETIRFVFHNSGQLRHEAAIGDEARQTEHEMEMANMAPGASEMPESEHDEVTVKPGETGTLDYTFDTPGTLVLGCHEPGHYKAGMVATITVK
ncbi:MAG: plastocyanin/azurin family copper-binding protein [Chloroflexota bacterium]